MPVGAVHDVENALDVSGGDVLMKKVAHGIDENTFRSFPTKGQLQHLRLQSESKSVSVIALAHGFEAIRETFGVTMLASRADFGAAGHGIPGCVGPFDVRISCHGASPRPPQNPTPIPSLLLYKSDYICFNIGRGDN